MAELVRDDKGRLLFTEEMKKEYTILCPNMADIHFRLILNVLKNYGYKAELLTNSGANIAQEGLKYVHNDTCYPALLVIGQFIDALNSGKYDVNKVALIITQTGGGCRASNYIHLLRKALVKAGYENVPVISLNLAGLEKNPGFSMSIPMIRRFIAALVYGDALMLLDNQVKPYEIHKGDSAALVQKWIDQLTEKFSQGKAYSIDQQTQYLKQIVDEFAEIPVERVPRSRWALWGKSMSNTPPLPITIWRPSSRSRTAKSMCRA